MSSAVAIAASLVAITLGLGGAVAFLALNWRGGSENRLTRELQQEREAHNSTRAVRDDAQAALRDEKSKSADLTLQVNQGLANNQLMAGKLDGYERIFRAIEGPIFDLEKKVEKNQQVLDAHNENVLRHFRRIVALIVDLMRLEGDKRSTSSILAETEDRDL